jgi:NADH-ubiquinone oxidoreductase chain 3
VPVIVIALLALNLFFAQSKPNEEKLSTFECGFSPVEQARQKFSIHFYLVGILFLVFDLEVLLLFPAAVSMYSIAQSGFWILLFFLVVLTAGFVYEYASGALNYASKEKDSELPPYRFEMNKGPLNKVQFRNYHVSSLLRKEDNSKNGDNLPDAFDNSQNSLTKELDVTFKIWLITNKPVKEYLNSEESKLLILKENKNKSGIYLWLNKENEKYYIGSSNNLTRRFSQYFNENYLKTNDYYIQRALLNNKFNNFSLYVLEYCDTEDLLKKEQYYFDLLTPPYNVLKIAGSSLGRKYNENSLKKMSDAKVGKYLGESNPMYGKKHNEETLLKIRTAAISSEHNKGINNSMFGKIGENNPFFGKTHTEETRLSISLANKGIAKSEEHKNKLRVPKTEEHKVKISMSKNKLIYVYSKDNPTILFKTFNSQMEASIYFGCGKSSINRYKDTGKVFLEKWLIFSNISSNN